MATSSYDVPGSPPALGAVVEEGRGSLPFELIHGEALVACASWSLGDSGVTPVDLGTEWAGVVDSGEPFVLHDALCPMTPARFIAECVTLAVERDTVVVGVRPVTDTVKRLAPGGPEAVGDAPGGAAVGAAVGETVDRAGLVAIASPVVLPAGVVAVLEALPSLDFAELVTALRARFPVELVEAPPAARRVASEADVRLLEALTAG